MNEYLNFTLQMIQALLIIFALFFVWVGFTVLIIGMYINRKMKHFLRK